MSNRFQLGDRLRNGAVVMASRKIPGTDKQYVLAEFGMHIMTYRVDRQGNPFLGHAFTIGQPEQAKEDFESRD